MHSEQKGYSYYLVEEIARLTVVWSTYHIQCRRDLFWTKVSMDIFTNISTTEEVKPTTSEYHDANVSFHDISEEIRHIIENVLFLGVVLPVCVFGFPSNIISCVVFWKQGLGDRMNLCLFCLAVSDCLQLLCSFTVSPVTFFIRLYNHNIGDEYYTRTMACLNGLVYAFRCYSGFISVVIAVERCVSVVVPFRASTLIRTRTMGIILSLSFLFIQTCYVFSPLSSRAAWIKQNNITSWYLDTSTFYTENTAFVESFIVIGIEITVPTATFIMITLMTTITVIKLKIALK